MVGRVLVPCEQLEDNLQFFTATLGMRIERISPADAPREVDLSGGGLAVRLVRSEATDAGSAVALELDATVDLRPGTLRAPNGTRVDIVERTMRYQLPDLAPELVISRVADAHGFGAGRAGMGYRDLIPSRLGGRFIASHILIADGGDVPDYAHFHRVRFQLIYCRRGWVEVVYEDQGEPFVLEPGDCVIQPPEIRHEVLRSSAGLEVVEIGCPAEHDTFADHDITLPTGRLHPERKFSGQRFVRHVAAAAVWEPWRRTGWEMRCAQIAVATEGLAEVRTIRPTPQVAPTPVWTHGAEFCFYFVLEGRVTFHVNGQAEVLAGADSVTVPADLAHAWSSPSPDLQLLEVLMPGAPDFTPVAAD